MVTALRRLRSPVIVLSSLVIFFSVGTLGAQLAARSPGSSSHASSIPLHTERTSPLDLEVGGDLSGVPAGSTRYLSRSDLLALPQVSYTVAHDPNFTRPTLVSGVSLEELAKHLSARPQSDLVLAICDDLYRANYPHAYVAAHHPLLVLTINGQAPDGWPKDAEGHGMSMGPFLISHPEFTPSFKVRAHEDEAQVPWGVVRIEFRNEQVVLGAIAPRGPNAGDPAVQDGYRIAQQNCFRCHNNGSEGGQKAGHPWMVLAAWAAASPEYFTAYVHDPKKKNPNSQMPGFPNYDDATMQALIAYFRTFAAQEKP